MKTKSLWMPAAFALAFVLNGKAQTAPASPANQPLAYVCLDLNPTSDQSYALSIVNGQAVGVGVLSGALLWSCGSDSPIDLNWGGYWAQANATSGTQQVGSGDNPTNVYYHALLWSGTPESIVDLNPAGYYASEAVGVCGNQQIGDGLDSITRWPHALIWYGSASNFVDINPDGFVESWASGTSGSQQVGGGAGNGGIHALLWSGTAASVVDLNPPGFSFSEAYGISGDQQVGTGFGPATGTNFHALLWYGTPSSAVDLNPSGWTVSQCSGCYGNYQVGAASLTEVTGTYAGIYQHAMLWSGTSNSAVDLHQYLSSDYTNSSAFGIDEYGNIAGWAYGQGVGQHAIEWVPLPNSIVISNDPGDCGAVWTLANCAISSMCSPPSGTFLPVGTNLITCTIINSASSNGPIIHTFTVTVKDCQPPRILGVSASPQVLWPPNNQMVPVTVNVSATDNSHVAGSKIISVTSNELDGNPDWQITGDLTLNLRASRSGSGSGRIYTITVQCTDDSGNAATNTVSVSVPLSQGNLSTTTRS